MKSKYLPGLRRRPEGYMRFRICCLSSTASTPDWRFEMLQNTFLLNITRHVLPSPAWSLDTFSCTMSADGCGTEKTKMF